MTLTKIKNTLEKAFQKHGPDCDYEISVSSDLYAEILQLCDGMTFRGETVKVRQDYTLIKYVGIWCYPKMLNSNTTELVQWLHRFSV